MTLLTVDAKLMPVLPLMLRPDSKTALTVAFGMGSAFRSALIAGLKTDAVELVPSVPLMFGFFYPDASSVLANPNGRVIVDRRPEPRRADRQDLRHHRHRPAAADRELRRVGHLVARVLPGRPRPPEPRRDHDAVDAVRLDASTSSRPISARSTRCSRTSSSRSGPAATASTCSAQTSRWRSTTRRSTTVLARPGVLKDISSAYDSPRVDGRWLARADPQPRLDRGRRRSRSSPATAR